MISSAADSLHGPTRGASVTDSRPLRYSAALLAVLTVLILALPARGQDPPTVTVESTHQGLTAEQWSWRTTKRVKQVRRLAMVVKRQRKNFRAARFTSPIGNHWLETSFMCIHRYEGSWTANTANRYDGGLQMDFSFQRTYGPEFLDYFGPAYLWPRSVQLAVAIKAYVSGRGFGPWPSTRRMCGL